MTILDRLDQVQDMRGRLTALSSPPRSMKIETTTNCNHKCSYCSRQYDVRQHGNMSFGFYCSLLDQAKALGVKEIGPFFLGEPFTQKDIGRWVDEAKKRDFFVFLTTNGTATTPGKIKEVMAAGLDSLKFSCNYADAEEFARLACVSPRLFARIEENVRAAREIRDTGGYECELSASSIMYTGEQREKTEAYMARIARLVDVTYYNCYYAMSVNADEIESTTGYRPNVGNPGRLRFIEGKWKQIRSPVPCWSLWELHVGMGDWDAGLGDYRYHVSACCFNGAGTFNMGDLNGPKALTLAEAWNSPEFQKLRQAHIDGKILGTLCESCITGAQKG